MRLPWAAHRDWVSLMPRRNADHVTGSLDPRARGRSVVQVLADPRSRVPPPPQDLTAKPSMSLTPNSQLDLAFDPSLLSDVSDVGEGLFLRPLASDDRTRGHLEVLQVLTKVSDPGAKAYAERFALMKASSATSAYFPIVILDSTQDRIVATGTVFVEHKFIRGLGCVGHIEDIAVDASMQGRSLGKKIIHALTHLSKQAGAYKVILDCDAKNTGTWGRAGNLPPSLTTMHLADHSYAICRIL